MLAVVFPGQGSQSVGMGAEFLQSFPIAREVMEETDETLKMKLSKIILEGPENELTLTQNTQPSLLASSIMMLKVMEHELNKNIESICQWSAGHSLGEYTALCASGVFSFSDSLKLVKLRGQSMQNSVPIGVGSMAAILGIEYEITEHVIQNITCNDNNYVGIANDNSPGQVVISGHTQAVQKACDILLEKGAKRCVTLPVSAPFHSKLMKPAADIMNEALNKTNIHHKNMELIMNVTALPLKQISDIRELLVQQITNQVKWRESILKMIQIGCSTFIEVGPGKVLSGLIKRIVPQNKDIKILNINSPETLESVLKVIT